MAAPYTRDADLLRDLLVPLVFASLIFTAARWLWLP